MPRGQNPNSLANLKKGRASQFGANGDRTAKEAGIKSGEARREIHSVAEEMRAIVDEQSADGTTRRKALAAKLVLNMDKSPEWYKLGLRMLGELPPEQVEVSKPAMEMAGEIQAALEERARERSAD